MNCWDVLQLAPTTDVRAIKKAYAVLLKQNRPDDNPAGFQRVHGAYQDALSWAEDNTQPDAQSACDPAADPLPSLADSTPALTPPEPVAAAPGLSAVPTATADATTLPRADTAADTAPHLSEAEQWETYLDQQWDTLVQQVEALLDDPAQRNEPSAWRFLMESEALLDIDFKSAFAMRFLQRLLELFREQQDTQTQLLQPAIVQHLNQWFWWSERRHQYDDYVDPQLLDDFLLWWQAPPVQASTTAPLPAQAPVSPVPYGNYYLRWLALVIDGAGLLAIGALGGLLLAPPGLEWVAGMLVVVAGYPLLSPLFEATPLQGTPGKYLCKLKVCDRQGKPIGFPRALLRSALFGVCLYFFYVTVIINLLIWDGRLLHDRLSGSVVLRRP